MVHDVQLYNVYIESKKISLNILTMTMQTSAGNAGSQNVDSISTTEPVWARPAQAVACQLSTKGHQQLHELQITFLDCHIHHPGRLWQLQLRKASRTDALLILLTFTSPSCIFTFKFWQSIQSIVLGLSNWKSLLSSNVFQENARHISVLGAPRAAVVFRGWRGSGLAQLLQDISKAWPRSQRHQIFGFWFPSHKPVTGDIWALSVQCEVTMLLQPARHPSFFLQSHLVYFCIVYCDWPTCTFLTLILQLVMRKTQRPVSPSLVNMQGKLRSFHRVREHPRQRQAAVNNG